MPIDMKTVDPAMQGPLDPIGHNAGPDLDLEARISALELAYDRAPAAINDIEAAQRMADFCRQIDVCLKRADDARKAEKRPYDLAAFGVNKKYEHMLGGLLRARQAIRSGIRQWLIANDRQSVTGDYGATASLRAGENITFDRDGLDWSAIHKFISDEAIERAIQAALAAGAQNIKGVDIVATPSLQVR